MSCIKYHTTDRSRMCKLCGTHIVRNTWAIQMRNIHISPKTVDIHFHEGCFFRALDDAKKEYGALK